MVKEVMYIKARYKKEIKLTKELLKELKNKKIALYASIQFTHLMDKVKKQLKDVRAITSVPDRASEKYQILGCDCFPESLNLKEDVDAYLYIGDGIFHPQALVLGQKDNKEYKDVIIFNPIDNKHRTLKKNLIEKIIRRNKSNISKFLLSKNIGVFVTTKPGQSYPRNALLLKEKLKDKNVFIFLGDNMTKEEAENFPFIECWVNTACPRIGYDDSMNYKLPIVNINEILNL